MGELGKPGQGQTLALDLRELKARVNGQEISEVLITLLF